MASRSSRVVDASLWFGAVLWALATFVLTLGPTPPDTDPLPLADKVFHLLAYAVMVLLLALAADRRPGRGPGPLPGSARWFAVLAVSAGGALELLQRYTGREAELLDWVADGAGVLIGWSLWALINRRRPSVPRAVSDRP